MTPQQHQDLSLESIMQTLRSPTGCPWDREQDHQSLRRFLIEECYECCEAIDQGDDEHLCEELGDVLLQVVFHAQLAKERGAFDMDAVERGTCEKMIRRHPHVFGDKKVNNSKDVMQNWDIIKQKEKGHIKTAHQHEALDEHLPKGLPAVQKALKIQSRAAKKGFDWQDVQGALDKLKEEIGELQEAIENENQSQVEQELGDVLFASVKVGRFLKVDPEAALHKTNHKFSHRFQIMEKDLTLDGKKVNTESLETLVQYWNRAKRKEH
jgi:tetrapyrrole methylase family protein/MazG family protein